MYRWAFLCLGPRDGTVSLKAFYVYPNGRRDGGIDVVSDVVFMYE